MYAPCDPQALLLMGALGNTAPGLFTPAQTDALTRKGVLMQQGDTSRWVALLLQADAMVKEMRLFHRLPFAVAYL
jgi:hypothetical protein